MKHVFESSGLTKRFGDVTALAGIDLALPRGVVVGLIGKNGSGKTTLLRSALGLCLPDAGQAVTLGRATSALGPQELARIGAVHQENRLFGWMTVERHLEYVAGFYGRWDVQRQTRLLERLELDPRERVDRLTPGGVQKLALVIAVCHHPELLLLDEPVSALDPIARAETLAFLLELLQEDGSTIVVSSHVLHDVERVVDWIVCLDRGRRIESAPLEELQERYAEWNVVSRNAGLPVRFVEPFVLEQKSDGRQARLVVRDAASVVDEFSARHHAEIAPRALGLERIFPLLLRAGAERGKEDPR